MPIAILIIGILLVSSGIKGTEHELSAQLSDDLTGNDGFIVWIVAFILIGLISKIPGFKTPAQWFLALTLVAIVLRNSNLSNNLISAIQGVEEDGPAQSVALQTPSQSSGSGSSGAGGSVGGSDSEVSSIEEYAALAALA